MSPLRRPGNLSPLLRPTAPKPAPKAPTPAMSSALRAIQSLWRTLATERTPGNIEMYRLFRRLGSTISSADLHVEDLRVIRRELRKFRKFMESHSPRLGEQPVLPAITRQPGFLWFVVKDSCVERLFLCTSASSLIMMSSHWCAPPSRSRKTLALWLPTAAAPGRCRGPRCCWTLAACFSPPSSSSGRDRPRSLRCRSR